MLYCYPGGYNALKIINISPLICKDVKYQLCVYQSPFSMHADGTIEHQEQLGAKDYRISMLVFKPTTHTKSTTIFINNYYT